MLEEVAFKFMEGNGCECERKCAFSPGELYLCLEVLRLEIVDPGACAHQLLVAYGPTATPPITRAAPLDLRGLWVYPHPYPHVTSYTHTTMVLLITTTPNAFIATSAPVGTKASSESFPTVHGPPCSLRWPRLPCPDTQSVGGGGPHWAPSNCS